MDIAILGATGRVGSALREEALRRGHRVTAVARGASQKLEASSQLKVVDVDLADAAALTAALKGQDAVLSAVRFATAPASAVIEPVRKAGVGRLLVVGGAGSLHVAPGVRVIDSPDFPAAYREEAQAGIGWLETLRQEPQLDWTFLSPSALFAEGPRTGKFRLGHDDLLIDGKGNSSISFADFAIALIDELERPAHSRQRFTVGY